MTFPKDGEAAIRNGTSKRKDVADGDAIIDGMTDGNVPNSPDKVVSGTFIANDRGNDSKADTTALGVRTTDVNGTANIQKSLAEGLKDGDGIVRGGREDTAKRDASPEIKGDGLFCRIIFNEKISGKTDKEDRLIQEL